MKIVKKLVPYLFISPAMILLSLFSLIPIMVALVISFTDLDIKGLIDYSSVNFIGLENYKNIIFDPLFQQSIGNTIFYVVIGVPLIVLISMFLAIAINFGDNKFFAALRMIFYSPAITNVVAVAVVFSYLYNPTFGFINYILSLFNISPIPWLTDPTIAKVSLIILGVWRAIGVNMLIYLAALQGIPKELYEASSLDGANKMEQIRYITIPSLKFSTFFVTVTTLIGWLQFFEEPFVMTGGGPLNGTTSVALFIYQNGFKYSKFGYAAAGSFVLFFAIICITMVQFYYQNRNKD